MIAVRASSGEARTALLIALALCGARADEYAAGGGALQYGAAPDDAADYRGHAPLDYKYEQEPPPAPGETETPKYSNDADRWREPGRIHRRRKKVKEIERLENELDSDAVTRLKSSRRRFRHGERGRRRPAARARADLDDEDGARYLDRYREDRSEYLEEDDYFSRKETTERIIRRKPRDRNNAPLSPKSAKDSGKVQEFLLDEIDEKLDDSRKRADKFVESVSYWGRESDEGEERAARATLPPAPRGHGAREPNAYQDYNDYYNVKAITESKPKLSVLPRRTSTSELPLGSVRAGAAPARPRATLRPERRTHYSEPEPEPELAPTDRAPVFASRTGSIAPPGNVTELSLAERSRLSVLKQFLTKKKALIEGTRKPPVLLLATSSTVTVVMLHAVGREPWLRARVVSGGAPRTLRKVKRLMREKLVAAAKDIRDVTANWNDTVCDYMDVSQLSDRSRAPAPAPALAGALALLARCLARQLGTR